MPHQFFSDRETGPRPQTSEQISEPAWGGIIASIRLRLEDGSFGFRFPFSCPDGNGVCGSSEADFTLALRGDIPDVSWPLRPETMPPKSAILDLAEFCFQSTGKPVQGSYHSFFGHYHLTFDQREGQHDFRETVNRMLPETVLPFELNEDGRIERLAPEGIRESLPSVLFQTGDSDLNSILEVARSKYLNPDLANRKDSLEKLWDAWERLKTLEHTDKGTHLHHTSLGQSYLRINLSVPAEKGSARPH